MLYLTDQKRRKKVKCIVLVYIHFQDGQFSPSKGISNEIYILFSARKASCFPIFTIKTQLGNPNRLPAVNWISRITKRVVIGSTHCTMLWPFQIKTLVQSLIMPLQLQVFYHLKHKRTRFTRLHPHTHTHTLLFIFTCLFLFKTDIYASWAQRWFLVSRELCRQWSRAVVSQTNLNMDVFN